MDQLITFLFGGVSQMIRFAHFFGLLFLLNLVVGCGDGGGVVATQDEMKAYAAEHGDESLPPGSSTDITD